MLGAVNSYGQTLSGIIKNNKGEVLIGARIWCPQLELGTIADSSGNFSLTITKTPKAILIISYPEHESDSIPIGNKTQFDITLQKSKTLEKIEIVEQQDGVIISHDQDIKTEHITQAELSKSACCDMAGCFETQTTVQPQTTNVITNSKELRILGLSGVYNQVLIDGLPMIQALSYTYGISGIPGTLVDNIYISKGANSVLQGYESMSGQINVETKDPDKGETFLFNSYINSFGEKHLNSNFSFRKNKWSNLSAVHVVQPANRIDRDGDYFLDLPLLERYSFFNKTKYGNENEAGWFTQFTLRYMREYRMGGQVNFNPAEHTGSNQIYGQVVSVHHPEIYSKTGYRFNARNAISLMASGFYQNQHSYFGTLSYQAEQKNAYANLQYEYSYGEHNVKSGVSIRQLDLYENLSFPEGSMGRTYAGLYKRKELIPGAFAENTLVLLEDKITWLTGLRADHHNQFGTQVTPRTLFKIRPTPNTTLRLSAGTGWRTVNLFSENIGLFISSRDIQFAEPLEPEKAINYGINITQDFESNTENLSGLLSVDFYHTQFSNQIFPDYDTDPTQAIIRNFRGISISDGFQAELNLKFYKRFEWKTGYTWLFVYRETQQGKTELPFNPRHKLLGSFSYKPLSDRFHLDVNVHIFGKQRLPDTRLNPDAFRRPDYSESYMTMNAQFTYTLSKWEFYTGCENILDFRQRQPIVSWQQPFSPWFDTSSVWGPTRGRELYIGVRFKLSPE